MASAPWHMGQAVGGGPRALSQDRDQSAHHCWPQVFPQAFHSHRQVVVSHRHRSLESVDSTIPTGIPSTNCSSTTVLNSCVSRGIGAGCSHLSVVMCNLLVYAKGPSSILPCSLLRQPLCSSSSPPLRPSHFWNKEGMIRRCSPAAKLCLPYHHALNPVLHSSTRTPPTPPWHTKFMQ